RFAAVGFNRRAFLPSYGMAEATLAISIDRAGHGVRVDRVDGDELAGEGRAQPVGGDARASLEVVNCGPAFDGHDVAIFSPDDDQRAAPLPDRVVGEIRVRGPSVTSGYYGEPALTQRAFAGGWLKTGDLGYLVDGDVFICGRQKELII